LPHARPLFPRKPVPVNYHERMARKRGDRSLRLPRWERLDRKPGYKKRNSSSLNFYLAHPNKCACVNAALRSDVDWNIAALKVASVF